MPENRGALPPRRDRSLAEHSVGPIGCIGHIGSIGHLHWSHWLHWPHWPFFPKNWPHPRSIRHCVLVLLPPADSIPSPNL